MVSSPKPPNPYQTASADQASQIGAASASSIINNPNEVNPYGTVNYGIAGYEQVPDANGTMQYVPRYTRTTKLSPDEQVIAGYDTGTRSNLGLTAMQQSAKLGNYLNTSIDTSKWTPWQTGHAFNESTDRPAIEKAMLARYQDTAKKQGAQQDTQLALRGMSPGSQGWSDVSDARNRADVDAQQQAYLASGQEARSNYQTAQSYWDMMNQLRGAQSQEAMALRNQPINEITALMSGAQVNVPQFAAYSRQGINAAPIGQYIQDNYANQVQSANATNQGLFSLGGSLAGAGGYAYGRR
jgi:hypothetical protein